MITRERWERLVPGEYVMLKGGGVICVRPYLLRDLQSPASQFIMDETIAVFSFATMRIVADPNTSKVEKA